MHLQLSSCMPRLRSARVWPDWARCIHGITRHWPDAGFKTHHYIIWFVRPLLSKPGMESYCWPSTDHYYHGRYMVLKLFRCQRAILIMFRCVLSQLKTLFTTKNVELLGLYPIQYVDTPIRRWHNMTTLLKQIWKWNKWSFRPHLCTYIHTLGQENSWGWWDEWDDSFLQTVESRALAVWGRARYLSVMEAPRNIESLLCFFETWKPERG